MHSEKGNGDNPKVHGRGYTVKQRPSAEETKTIGSYREKIYSRYFDFLAKYGQEKELHEELNYRAKIYDINYKTILPEGRNKKILELGCGPGFFLKYLSDHGYNNCQGIDSSEQQIRLAGDLGIRAVTADIFGYLLKTSDEFDVICSFHVLEHLFKHEIMHLLELIYDRLDLDGMIIVEVPNAGSPLLGSHNRYIDFTHEVGFTPPSLREVLLASGFVNVKIYPVRDVSLYARFFFKMLNYFLHSRFTKDEFVEGGLIGVGCKKD
jgi:SAM-dependent methyltransferase